MPVRIDNYVPSHLIRVSGMKLPDVEARAILSVSITETCNQADSFAIRLRDHYPDPESQQKGRLSWVDNTTLEEGKEIEIELGYQNNRGVKLTGYITGITTSFTEDGGSTMTVRGYSKYLDLQRTTRSEAFEKMTDSEIAKKIAAALHLSPDVGETGIQHWLVSYPENATYAHILEECARRNNYEVTVKENKLIFRRPRYLDNPPFACEFAWGEDLRSVSIDINAKNMPSSITAATPETVKRISKKQGRSTVWANEIPAVLGTKSGPARAQAAWGKNDQELTDEHLATPEEAKQRAKAELQRRGLEYITASGSCIGNPKLVSRTLITLTKLGPRCSGKYYVTSTTHTIDANGYRTDFVAKRDAR